MLTGRIRHRSTDLYPGARTFSGRVLVLQLEEQSRDGSKVWRDAQTEDLTTITLNSLTEVKQQ